MPITRTPWIDDDGTGTTGTIINNAEKQLLYNQIDAALLTVGGGLTTVISNTDVGTINDWAPTGLKNNTFIRWSGLTNLLVTGLAGGVVGQIVTIGNYSSAVLSFAHIAAGSAVGNKFVNAAASAPTPIASRGYATFIYGDIGGQNGWNLIGHEQGAWITPPFAASDFDGNGGAMTWTVEAADRSIMRYRLSGTSIILTFELLNTSLSGTATALLRMLRGQWGGFNTVVSGSGFIVISDAGIANVGGRVLTSAPDMLIQKAGGAAWTIGVNNTAMFTTFMFEVA